MSPRPDLDAVKHPPRYWMDDGWRCVDCGYFVRGDLSFEEPPAECENCAELADALRTARI